MKAVRAAEGGVHVVDLAEPPGTGELLDVRSASICSSDLAYIALGSRRILGHELAGVLADGTAVVVEALYGCHACDQCRSGRYNLCPTHPQRALGVTADGGMAQRFRAPLYLDEIVPVETWLSFYFPLLVRLAIETKGTSLG